MIGPRETFPEAVWEEKRAAPRALHRVAGGWYAPPLRPDGAAWIAWVDRDLDATLDAMIARAEADRAGSLRVGGPPGNYLTSGAREGEVAAFAARGFAVIGEHVDLEVDPRVPPQNEPRVAREAHPDALLAWIERAFGGAWAMEARRAASHGALFVAREGDRTLGFAAHSGNNAALGTFGPIGVADDARGLGLGGALADAAFEDLARRGFERVLVPWVDLATVPFYARRVTVHASHRRVSMRRLARTG